MASLGTSVSFSNTILIVGAGAHVPYQMPTSQGLTSLIKQLYQAERVISLSNGTFSRVEGLDKDKLAICRLLRDLDIVPRPEDMKGASNAYDILVGDALDGFLNEFARSQVYSIDKYLAKMKQDNPKDERSIKIGKLLIAYFISAKESEVPVGFHAFDWIQYLINEFLTDPEKLRQFFEQPPILITFNYDNFFEKSLLAHLNSYHAISKEEALKMIQSLNIVHVYGDLNTLDHVVTPQNLDFFRQALTRIRVIGEERSEEALVKIQNKIYSSLRVPGTQVYFLGFGFDATNLETLFAKCPAKNEDEGQYAALKFYSSTFKLNLRQKTEVRNSLKFPVIFQNEDSCDCLTLIQERHPIFKKVETTKSSQGSGGSFSGGNSWMS